jgi:hypothetical protein
MKGINTFQVSPEEVSIYVSSKDKPSHIWAIANSPYPQREIDHIQIQPRSLKRDLLEAWPLHLVLNIMFVGLPCLGYIGFWLYERCVPLWDVRIRYAHPRIVNPLHTVIELAEYQ